MILLCRFALMFRISVAAALSPPRHAPLERGDGNGWPLVSDAGLVNPKLHRVEPTQRRRKR